MLGRLVDPLGRPLDDKGDISTSETRPAEFKAPGVVQRQPVTTPVQTGLKAIDGMIPIGRGQRELIIGDRQTGKTAIAIDTIINNQRQGPRLRLRRDRPAHVDGGAGDADSGGHGAMDNTVIVAAPADEAAPIKFIAPYAGCAMAEHFLYDGKDALLRLRRPHQARLRLPADVAASAPPARAARRIRETSSTCTRACWSVPCG